MKDKVNISLAHTNADYDTAKAAFDAGLITQSTYTMPCLHLPIGCRESWGQYRTVLM